MACIFLSYRRKEDRYVIGRIRDRLLQEAAVDDVFTDVDSIPAGADVGEYIGEQVDRCDVFIAAIGRHWASMTDASGAIRIRQPEDFVRLEVSSAIACGKPIIPVLVSGATMPTADQLPDDIRSMAGRNAAEIRPDPDFHKDMDRLIATLTEMVSEEGRSSGRDPTADGHDIDIESASVHDPADADVGDVQRLRALRSAPKLSELPFIMRCLADAHPDIQRRAMQVTKKIEWPDLSSEAERIARSQDDQSIDDLLSGLAAIRASDRTVALLARLCELLTAEHQNRAFAITERKRLASELDVVSQIFRERNQAYELESVLGQGLFATSYLARHQHSNRLLVIRILRKEYALRDDIRTEILALWNRSSGYVHQSLVLTREANQFADRGLYFCVRDYIDGTTLDRKTHGDRRLEKQAVFQLLREIVSALRPVHKQGWAHGGVKPSNIFVTEDHGAILGDTALKTTTVAPEPGRLRRDYPYEAPESFDTSRQLVPQSDYYAIGCIAFELLSGRPPFLADDAFEIASMHRRAQTPELTYKGVKLPQEAQHALGHLLAKRPEDRPADSDQMLQALDVLEGSLATLPDDSDDPEPSSLRPLPADRTMLSMDELGSLEADHTILRSTAGEATDRAPGRRRSIEVETVLNKRFLLEQRLGEGGMSEVYKARDLLREEGGDKAPHVAIKILSDALASNPEFVDALQREARRTQSLAHPNIMTVYDFDRDGDEYFVVMELLVGEQLDNLIRRRQDRGSPLPLSEALPILEGLAAGLAYAHAKGVVHSDFKPSNAFVTADGVAKVFDFGISRAMTERAQTHSEGTVFDRGGITALTPAYASPELFRGDTLSGRSDTFSFACTAYELLSGEHPFGKKAASEAASEDLVPLPVPGLARHQNAALRKALAFDPAERTASPSTLVEALKDGVTRHWGRYLLRSLSPGD